MSRIANMPISLPKGVEFKSDQGAVSVKGPKGTLALHSLPGVIIKHEGDTLSFDLAKGGEVKFAGTARALIANMVKGVTEGFERKLELVGVGYRASMQGKNLNLSVGFSHPVAFEAPEGVTIETPIATEVVIKGANKQLVGQIAAKIRAVRPPEPYKGKGIRFAGEHISLKEAKKA